MARVLILEGNPPELLAARYKAGLGGMAEVYATELRRFAPALEVRIVRPYFPDYAGFDPAIFGDLDGVVCTGSGVEWSAADARAHPFWELYEATFARGLPMLGSCWGLQIGAVVLGGGVAASPNGTETALAREIRLTEAGSVHPLHAGRAPVFDALCIHRDEVSALPEGAVVTASNRHSQVQGMVVEGTSVRFWGVQYHPEMTLTDIGIVLDRLAAAAPVEDAPRLQSQGRDFRRLDANPEDADLAERYHIGRDVLDRDTHGAELRNWLQAIGQRAGARDPAMFAS